MNDIGFLNFPIRCIYLQELLGSEGYVFSEHVQSSQKFEEVVRLSCKDNFGDFFNNHFGTFSVVLPTFYWPRHTCQPVKMFKMNK